MGKGPFAAAFPNTKLKSMQEALWAANAAQVQAAKTQTAATAQAWALGKYGASYGASYGAGVHAAAAAAAAADGASADDAVAQVAAAAGMNPYSADMMVPSGYGGLSAAVMNPYGAYGAGMVSYNQMQAAAVNPYAAAGAAYGQNPYADAAGAAAMGQYADAAGAAAMGQYGRYDVAAHAAYSEMVAHRQRIAFFGGLDPYVIYICYRN